MSDLLRDPGRYDFYQAIRLIENGALAGVRGKRVGFDDEPRFEAARLRASTSLAFPVNAIESIVKRRSPIAGGGKAVEVTVAFMGALGTSGVLPWHYTEYVAERLSQRDKSLRDFVATLEHRCISFHYRAWSKYRLPFAYEAAANNGATDDVTAVLRAVVGLGTSHLLDRVVEGSDRWLYFAGQFARAQRTTAGLQEMLREVCGHPVEVQEFVGHWQTLLPEERTRLGGPPDDEFRNQLGASLILGERVWDVLSGVRIRIGPIPSQCLADLVPGTGRYPWLGELVRSYLGPDVDFEVVGIVEKATVESVRLGSSSTPLGASAWLSAKDSARYDAEVPVCSSR